MKGYRSFGDYARIFGLIGGLALSNLSCEDPLEDFRKMREKSVYRAEVERKGKSLDNLGKELKQATDEFEKIAASKDGDYSTFRKRIETDKCKWDILPMPKGSYRKDAGEDNNVMIPVRNFMQTEKGLAFEFRQDGFFDLIEVKTKAGRSYGEPGKGFKVEITNAEFQEMLKSGGIPIYVRGLDFVYEPATLEQTASYEGTLVPGEYIHIGESPPS